MPRYPEEYDDIEQLIAPDGSYDADAVAALDADEETLRSMYETMIRSRALEERGMILQRQGGLHFWEKCTGEEAAHAGPAAALADNDAYTYLRDREALVRTGPTGTNVNDFRVVVVPETKPQ